MHPSLRALRYIRSACLGPQNRAGCEVTSQVVARGALAATTATAEFYRSSTLSGPAECFHASSNSRFTQSRLADFF